MISLGLVFVAGYLLIAMEHQIRLNKAATALLTGVSCWTLLVFFGDESTHIFEALPEHMGEISGILFFLIGAMTIVELIDAHDGFGVIRSAIRTKNKNHLLWVITAIAFFLSAILDNLTTTIVIISLSSKLITSAKDRLVFAAMTVIAANAGGVWSPIGDVTTTMLWIGGQISAEKTVFDLFLPSMVSVVIPAFGLGLAVKGQIEDSGIAPKTQGSGNWMFYSGMSALLFVPVFKTFTGLPPFMGMLFSLGAMWVISEIINSSKDTEDRELHSINYALKKIDTPSILFFLGILLSVAALQTSGMLLELSGQLSQWIGNQKLIVLSLGLLSSIIDNVPLVAATQGMYRLVDFPTDHPFWQFIAYCSGTGGSILIIGSAAGVAAMGISKLEFFWYLRKVSFWALLGYFSGAIVFVMTLWR